MNKAKLSKHTKRDLESLRRTLLSYTELEVTVRDLMAHAMRGEDDSPARRNQYSASVRYFRAVAACLRKLRSERDEGSGYYEVDVTAHHTPFGVAPTHSDVEVQK